jgi:hypothetical protein
MTWLHFVFVQSVFAFVGQTLITGAGRWVGLCVALHDAHWSDLYV